MKHEANSSGIYLRDEIEPSWKVLEALHKDMQFEFKPIKHGWRGGDPQTPCESTFGHCFELTKQ